MNQLIVRNEMDGVINAVLDTVNSPESKRAYKRALKDFIEWYTYNQPGPISKAAVNSYKANLTAEGLSASNINQRLSAIRRLAVEAGDNGALDPNTAAAIGRVKGVKKQGRRLGNWLTKDHTEQLISTPDINTLIGKRDRAILAAAILTGLRRDELANLNFEHIQQREGRWIIANITGKGNRTRTIPMQAYAKAAIDNWIQAAGIDSGYIFRGVNKGDNLSSESMSAQAIYNRIKKYGQQIGIEIAPHDLRRTFAKLAHKGGAPIEQISLSLGHASIKTTEIYLGIEQNLTQAPTDYIHLNLQAI